MRLWSLHPRYLDAKGLLALWREGLLARKVLMGETKGYRHHPQLIRFREAEDPAMAINAYLAAVVREAQARNYQFDATKLTPVQSDVPLITVTTGQMEYEFNHLLNKLKNRHPDSYQKFHLLQKPEPHPLFQIVPGLLATWEKI